MKQPIETIKQLVVFLLIHKTLFLLKPVSKTLSMKQPIEMIKQLVVFLLLHKTLF